ncbi:murein L,D-transpeptidase family protein [Pseudomonadota bacterium]
MAQEMAQNSRSNAAMTRVLPGLEADLADAGLELGARVFIRTFKAENELEVWLQSPQDSLDQGIYEKLRTYSICAWSGDLGPKNSEGDGQTPEGFYFVTPNRMKPDSDFYLSFNLGYPNAYDRQHGRTGSFLMVHGDCASVGCFAMGDLEMLDEEAGNDPIREIWTLMTKAFASGQPYVRVHAFPFRMSESNMEAQKNHEWVDFWMNLKEGYDAFEATHRPPNTTVRAGRYVFTAESP